MNSMTMTRDLKKIYVMMLKLKMSPELIITGWDNMAKYAADMYPSTPTMPTPEYIGFLEKHSRKETNASSKENKKDQSF